MDIDKLKRTGLTQNELAALFGVTRITVTHWMSGRFSPSRYLKERVEKVSQKLFKAAEAGMLPLPGGLTKDQRLAAVKALVGLE